MTHRSEVYGEAMSMLDGLPEGSVVLDVDGDAWQKQDVRWTSVARGANTELMGSNSLGILTPLTVVYRPDVEPREPSAHRCEECQTCGVHGNEHLKCCGCYDGVCCQEGRGEGR